MNLFLNLNTSSGGETTGQHVFSECNKFHVVMLLALLCPKLGEEHGQGHHTDQTKL